MRRLTMIAALVLSGCGPGPSKWEPERTGYPLCTLPLPGAPDGEEAR